MAVGDLVEPGASVAAAVAFPDPVGEIKGVFVAFGVAEASGVSEAWGVDDTAAAVCVWPAATVSQIWV